MSARVFHEMYMETPRHLPSLPILKAVPSADPSHHSVILQASRLIPSRSCYDDGAMLVAAGGDQTKRRGRSNRRAPSRCAVQAESTERSIVARLCRRDAAVLRLVQAPQRRVASLFFAMASMQNNNIRPVLECCRLNKADLQCLDFSSHRLFMKLFRTGSIDVVQECHSYFRIKLLSCLIKTRCSAIAERPRCRVCYSFR